MFNGPAVSDIACITEIRETAVFPFNQKVFQCKGVLLPRKSFPARSSFRTLFSITYSEDYDKEWLVSELCLVQITQGHRLPKGQQCVHLKYFIFTEKSIFR